MDLFVVPTIRFDLLYAFIIILLDRRDLVWINVTPAVCSRGSRTLSRDHKAGIGSAEIALDQ
jgi:hypothetical protein